MNLSRKKKRWVSLGVGIVGLVTILGLSDLLFLIPQNQAVPTQEVPSVVLPTATTTATSSSEVTVPITIPTSTPTTTPENSNEFKL